MHERWPVPKNGIRVFVGLLLTLALTGSALATNSWLNPKYKPGIQLELNIPSFNIDYGSSERSARSVMISAYVGVSQNTRLVLEVPWQRVAINNGYNLDITESGLGNIYLGAVWSRPGSSELIEIGVRAPLVNEDGFATAYAIYTVPDRLEAYLEEATSGRVAFGYRYESAEQLTVKFLAGPTVLHINDSDAEVLLDMRFESWMDRASFFAGGAFVARFVLTDEGEFADRLTSQMMFAGGLKFGSFQPGLNLIVPLDDDVSEVVDIVYGANFSYFFPAK